jgi:DNA-binding PadR family transcriptional regulator
MLGPIGVSKLRTLYGAKKNKGVEPEHFYRASGNHIRKMLQQLEAEGLIEQVKKGVHKGRKVSAQGQSFLRKIGSEVVASEQKSKKENKKEESKQKKKEKKTEKKEEKKPDKGKKQDKPKKSSKKNTNSSAKKKKSSKSPKKSKKKKEAKK